MTRRQHELGMFQLKTSGTPGEGAGYEKLIHWLKTFSLEFLVYWTWKNILCPPLFHSWVFLKDSVAPGGRKLLLPESPFWREYNVRSRKKCATPSTHCKINTLACTPCISILLDPNFHRFSCLFLSRVPVFKKCYYFTLGLTVILLLRGSLQRKPGFLWCIPKCLGERNHSGVWINPASSACQRNSATLHCWYTPRCTGCGWSLLLLLLCRDLLHNVCSNQIRISAGGCCEH